MRTRFLFLCFFFLAGCGGYAVQRTLPVDSVGLERIENRTLEPRLEDIMIEALTRSLMKSGIRVEPGSAHAIRGSIDRFQLKSLSEREGLTVSYEVIVRGSFYLSGPEGERELTDSGRFIVTFTGEGALEGVMAQKEVAVERALADMADGITASVIYGR